MAHELGCFLPAVYNHPPIAVPGRRRVRADVVLPDHLVVVEYDSLWWHDGRDAEDRHKTDSLEAAGWRVLRVREEGLPPVTDLDVTVPKVAPAKLVADRVLVRLRDALGLELPGLDAYLAEPECRAEDTAGAAILVEKRLRADPNRLPSQQRRRSQDMGIS